MKKILYLSLFIFVSITACKKDSNSNSLIHRVVVLNEGQFGTSTASITSYNPSTKEVNQNVFETINENDALGDVLQSARIIENELFLVVNNSQKIAVVDPKTFVLKRNLIMVESASPRYLVSASIDDILVSDLYAGHIHRLNKNNGEIVALYTMPNNSEGIERVGNVVFIANPGAYLAEANTVSYMNTDATQTGTLTVGTNPTQLFVDNQNRVWVSCTGTYDGKAPGKVVVIDGINKTILATIDVLGNPGDIAFNHQDSKAYVLNSSGVQTISMANYTLESELLVAGYFYAMNYDERDQKLYVTNPKTFAEAGELLVYSKSGELLDTVPTGIVPTFIHFVE